MSSEFKQGARVANSDCMETAKLGVVLKALKDNQWRVGWDDNTYTDTPAKKLYPVSAEEVSTQAFTKLTELQQNFLLALYNKTEFERSFDTYWQLMIRGCVSDSFATEAGEQKVQWEKVTLTPWGRYITQHREDVVEVAPAETVSDFIEAATPLLVLAGKLPETVPPIPEAIKTPEVGQLDQVLPPDKVSLFAEHDVAKELETLKAKNAELEDANAQLNAALEKERETLALLRDAVKLTNDDLREKQNVIDGLRLNLDNAKTKRFTLQPVGQVVERVISTSKPLDFEGKQGVFRTSFLPLLEQPKPEPSTVAITSAIGEQMQEAVMSDLELMVAGLPPELKAEAIHRMRTAQVALNVIFGDFGTEFKENAS